jgi:hypothetical protein
MGKSFKAMASYARGKDQGNVGDPGEVKVGGRRKVMLARTARSGDMQKLAAEARSGDTSKPKMVTGDSAPSVDIAKTPGSDFHGGMDMKGKKPASQQPDALGRKSKL